VLIIGWYLQAALEACDSSMSSLAARSLSRPGQVTCFQENVSGMQQCACGHSL
jgi:hypothetical protein